jgi:hypothetical protein
MDTAQDYFEFEVGTTEQLSALLERLQDYKESMEEAAQRINNNNAARKSYQNNPAPSALQTIPILNFSMDVDVETVAPPPPPSSAPPTISPQIPLALPMPRPSALSSDPPPLEYVPLDLPTSTSSHLPQVQAILDWRINVEGNVARQEYFVQWVGYADRYNSWVQECMLPKQAAPLVRLYKQSRKIFH